MQREIKIKHTTYMVDIQKCENEYTLGVYKKSVSLKNLFKYGTFVVYKLHRDIQWFDTLEECKSIAKSYINLLKI